MLESYDVLIVGGGHGGAQAAAMLRQLGYRGSVGLLGEEVDPPYERPPLSKEYLSQTKTMEQLWLRPPAAWAEAGVDLLLGRKALAVDPKAHRVMFQGGEVGYGQLVWAAGGAPRRLTCEGGELEGVHTVRNRPDVDRLVQELKQVRDVAVIGGGYIGLEAAAVLRHLGKRVVLVEALERVLARVAGEPLSRFIEAEHRSQGVDLRLSCAVSCIEAEGGRACGVRLADGEVLAAQMVIAGIGITPAVAPLGAAGAELGDGVRVDAFCRTSLESVFAIGDCAEHHNAYAGGDWVRLESVQNANDQAGVVAKAICGAEEPYRAVPWFWSNQYDLRLQTVGLSRNFDDMVVRGAPSTRSFSVVYLRGGRVIALDCVNAVRDYTQGRLLVAGVVQASRDALADTSRPLKALL